MTDYEQIAQEDQLWPWLADESMADETYDDWTEYEPPEPDYYCDTCGAGLTDEEAEGPACPECGAPFTEGDLDQ